MYNPIVLTSENQLNKLLRKQKRTGEEVNILFYSLWDPFAKTLVEALARQPSADWMKNGPKNLYLVDSFNMPHSTVIFRSTKLPHLVKLNRRRTHSEDYLPRIYKSLGLAESKRS